MHFICEMEEEIFYQLALSKIQHYGLINIKRINEIYGSAKTFFDEVGQGIMREGCQIRYKPVITKDIATWVTREMTYLRQHGISYCTYNDARYPYRLRNCIDAPSFFFYKGSGNFDFSKTVAIVGTRLSTPYGRDAVKKILSECTSYDLCVVSGLASGIDTAAHEESLRLGLNTVAIMGTGFGTIYPPGNRKLAEQIVEYGGTVISEYPFYSLPDKQNFPKRNRIIAGMSDATIVIETALRGGSMITAHIAHSYNRDVFAVPGPIDKPSSEGCNQLIRRNVAALLSSGNELAEMMGWNHQPLAGVQRSLFVELTDVERTLVDLLQQNSQLSIDGLQEKISGLSSSQLAGVLLQLELKGIIQCKPGKIYSLV